MMAADAATTGGSRLPGARVRRDLRGSPGSRLDELGLPLMVSDDQEAQRAASR